MNTQENGNRADTDGFRLIVLQGPGRGGQIDLKAGHDYVVGRAEECDIRIDMSDKTVSRRHARLNVTAGHIVVENMSQTNPVMVKGKPIQKATVKGKGEFRVGETLFAVEKMGGTGSSGGGKGIPPLRIGLIAAFLIICAGVLFILMTEDDKPPVPSATSTAKPSPDELPVTVIPSPGNKLTGGGFPATGLTISSEDIKKADQHFRQGMFFYDTGNLLKAVEEWNLAVRVYPDHPDAQTWFLRAERELAEKVKTHYQNAMVHYKYMRYKDAAHEFRLVVELSRDKASDQYLNALKSLNEIEGR